MTQTIIDPSLYCKFEKDELDGLNGNYVDDLLRAETNDWQTQSEAALERFETTGNEEPPFTFAGMHITYNQGMFNIDQDFYMSKIEQIPSDAEFSKFASMRMKLACLANTRQDLAFKISQIAKVTRAMFDQEVTKHCKRLNKTIKYANDNMASIRIPKLDFDSLRIVAYSDAAFANNADLSSQL